MQDQRRFQHGIVGGVFSGFHKHSQGSFIPVALHRQNAPDAQPDGIQSHTQSWQSLGIINAEKTALMAQERGRSPAKGIEGRFVAFCACRRAQGAFSHVPCGRAAPPVIGGIGQNSGHPVAGRLRNARLRGVRLSNGTPGIVRLHSARWCNACAYGVCLAIFFPIGQRQRRSLCWQKPRRPDWRGQGCHSLCVLKVKGNEAQTVREPKPRGIALCGQNQRIFALKPKTPNFRAQHGKAQQGSPAAAAQLGHKSGARVCRVIPALFRVFVRPAFIRRQVARGESGQQKSVRAEAQAALGLLQPSWKALARFDDMLRQGFLHGPSHIRKPDFPRMLTAQKYLRVAEMFVSAVVLLRAKCKASGTATVPRLK